MSKRIGIKIFISLILICITSMKSYGITEPIKDSKEIIDAKKEIPAEITIEKNIFNRTFEKEFDKGPIKDIKLIAGHIGYYLLTRENGAGTTHNEIDNNLPLFGLNGHFNDGTKYQFTWLPWYKIKNYEAQRHRIFQYFVQKQIGEHHKLTLGQDRTPVGMEGSTSMFVLPTGRRSLIAKKYNNITAIGVKVDGNWDHFEYKAGVFDSGRMLKNNFDEAPEFAVLAFFKPIKNNEKYGKFKIGGGYNFGKLDYEYDVLTFYSRYDYKKWHTDFEYNYADGYNSYVNSPDKSYGYYTSLYYDITKKLQVFTRIQALDPKKAVAGDKIRQLETGFNYFLRGEKLRFTASYVHTNNQTSADGNQLYFSTQLML